MSLRPGVSGIDALGWDDDEPEADDAKPECVDCGGPERASQAGEIVPDADGNPVHVRCLARRAR